MRRSGRRGGEGSLAVVPVVVPLVGAVVVIGVVVGVVVGVVIGVVVELDGPGGGTVTSPPPTRVAPDGVEGVGEVEGETGRA